MIGFEKSTTKILNYLSLIPKNPGQLSKYNMETITGKVSILGLINNKSISIVQMITDKGSETEWHSHSQTEHMMLYEGDPYIMEYEIEGNLYEFEVSITKGCYMEPNVPHRLKSSSGDSKSVIIIIPGSADFPKGDGNGSW